MGAPPLYRKDQLRLVRLSPNNCLLRIQADVGLVDIATPETFYALGERDYLDTLNYDVHCSYCIVVFIRAAFS